MIGSYMPLLKGKGLLTSRELCVEEKYGNSSVQKQGDRIYIFQLFKHQMLANGEIHCM